MRFREWPRRLPEGTKADCSLAIFFCFGCADGDGDGEGGNGDSDLLCDLLGGVRWYLGFADASPSTQSIELMRTFAHTHTDTHTDFSLAKEELKEQVHTGARWNEQDCKRSVENAKVNTRSHTIINKNH